MIKESKNEISNKSKFKGTYKIEKYKADEYGNAISDSKILISEFSNIITDFGLNHLATNNYWRRYCYLGSGTVEPTVFDTQLQILNGGGLNYSSYSNFNQTSPPYYATARTTWRFPAGTCTGNNTEIGIGSSATELFSRTLIKDLNGNPTVLSKLEDEILDVTYELRFYPFLSDVTGEITITGNKGSSTHQYIIRAANVTSNSYLNVGVSYYGGYAHSVYSYIHIYDGEIGSITSDPSGTSSYTTDKTLIPYENNSLESSIIVTFPITTGNFNTGIRSLIVRSHAFASYQIQFDPPIMKTEDDILSLTFKSSWGRI
jgi:hypothetical protein